MKTGARKFGAAERGLLPEGRMAGPMPWVIAIMMFLTVLAAAAGLGLSGAAARLNDQIGGRVTIQIVEASPRLRAADPGRGERDPVAARGRRGAGRARGRDPGAARAWLGAAAAGELPIPALIDVDLTPDGAGSTACAGRSPRRRSARVDDGGQWLAPLARLIGALQWLAIGLVLLMVGATAATVALAACAAPPTPIAARSRSCT